MAGGLVDVGVDRHDELEPAEGGVQPPGVGGGEHRVAGHVHHGADLPLAGRVDLLGQAGRRQLAHRLAQPRTRLRRRCSLIPRP